MNVDMEPFTNSTPILDDTNAIRQNADRDGYLFLRRFVQTDLIQETRRDITAILASVGWLDEDTDPIDAVSTRDALIAGTPEFTPIYDTIQKLESFHRLAHDPGLIHIVKTLLGPNALLQPSNIARVIFPTGLEHTTPPHQDYIHIQGTPDVWTAWFPLGDCPSDLGGLSVLAGSHKQGILPVIQSLGAGGRRTDLSEAAGHWVTSRFESGDVLFFHSHTIHQGIPNRSGNRIRLSVDYRYQRASDPIMELVLGPHQGRLSWEEVYAGWKSKEYQYYWEEHSLQPVQKETWPVVNET